MGIKFDEQKQKEKIEKLRRKEEEDLARILAKKYGVRYVDLTRVSIDTNALRLIKEEDAKKHEVAAFKKIGKKILLAVRSPIKPSTKEIKKYLEDLGYIVIMYMVSTASLKHAWTHYKDLSLTSAAQYGLLNISEEKLKEIYEKVDSVLDMQSMLRQSLQSDQKMHIVSELLEVLIAGGLALDVSDIHIEPKEEATKIRLRLDGVLTELVKINKDISNKLVARIKLLSGMKLNKTNIAQDGRFSVKLAEDEIEIRSSVIPGNYGETIVMRLLNPAKISLTLEKLGMDNFLLNIFKEEIRKPHGMILNTGPTGSGKTTTLYAFLREVNKPGIKIITIENPVEYHLQGIVQTQISKGYTFADALRAILRQDPDIIMVGEIRDLEVASTAVHAALTGHLVFSTLHTNNAAGTFPRLIDIGIDPEILGSALTLTMAQRLTRKLCNHCKRPKIMSNDEFNLINNITKNMPRQEDVPANRDIIWEPVGCSYCNNTGYKGRTAIFEAVLVDDEIKQIVRKNPSELEIWQAASHQKIWRMLEYGIVKVLEGVTSLEELKRVVDFDEKMR